MTLDNLITRHRQPAPVYVTRPALPPLDAYTERLEHIWESRWLTNKGRYHDEFEARLRAYLGVEHVSLFCNGTIALLVGLQALRINSGEVITTPFTFPATAHVLYWNGVTPVFADIDPVTLNLDPNNIERLITPNTKAILAVHVFGNPCDVDAIEAIAARHGLQVIYDAAHAFGVRVRGRPIVDRGDLSVLSFHATKPFTTGEGGAIVVRGAKLKDRIEFLKNFGIADEETVIGPGINGKMNEFQAAFGVLALDLVRDEIRRRRAIAGRYREGLGGIPGVTVQYDVPDVEQAYPYFPIRINPRIYGRDRDELHAFLKRGNIITRKYFYPLCSRYSCYASLPSARPELLPVAERAAREVLCLPIYGDLDMRVADDVCALVRGFAAP